MQRVLKFRAWDTKTGYWVEGLDFVIHTSGRILNIPEHVALMQWTGLQDRNGKDIYEGDKVQVTFPEYTGKEPDNGWVIWDTNEATWRIQSYSWWCYLSQGEMEVIGNLYETPDLLPQQEKREER